MTAAAERTRTEARAEAEARLAGVRILEQRAAEQAEQLRMHAMAEAAAARLSARDDVVRLLASGREARRRADAEAAATRERLDRDAETRTAALLADVQALERRRSALLGEIDLLAGQVTGTTGGRRELRFRPLLETIRWRPRSLRAP
jgi:hypothetical protein